MRKKYLKYVMIIPLLILLGTLTIYPVIYLVKMSFYSYEVTGRGVILRYIFGGNFKKLAKDLNFWISLKNTLIFVTGSVSLEFFLGLCLALLVRELRKGVSFIRAVLMFPMMIAPVAVGLIWKLMYNTEFGIINTIISKICFQRQAWLAEPNLAMLSVIVTDVWQWTPFIYLVLLAGLHSIPEEPYEAALVDGATYWQTFRYITVPLLKPTIFIALLFRSIGAFRAFDKFILLTGGGPGNVTEIVSLYIYKVSFRYWQLGYGSLLALTVILFIVMYSQSYQRVLMKR